MSTMPKDVAQWMMEELKRLNYLYQETVVYDIKSKFGDEFTYINDSGNLSINKKVLAEFRKINDDEVVWERSEKAWRFRQNYDSDSRQQD